MSLLELRAVHRVPGARGWLRKQVLRSVARVIEWTTGLPGRPLNVSRVTGQLLVGGHVPRKDYARLKALGVTCVIDARAERSDDAEELAKLGIELLHLPTPDRYAVPVEKLLEGVDWALPRLERGAQVYCHCQHGVGRGPLMGLSILVAQGWDAAAAYRTLREARWQATLNDRQLEGLVRFQEALALRSAG